jgi:ABC-type transporter Mla subunit MlaD
VTTTTETRDQATMRQTVDRLTETMAQLAQIADDATALANDPGSDVQGAAQIATFARAAADTVDLALMVARNEHALAQRR